ncbi:hypothetical protein PL371_03425 [Tenacibaculum maritimum]|nr:hypothetical protein [Tenacibaculum maritimum]
MYKKELEKEVDSIDKELVSYREKYDNGNISAENYIEINDILSKRKEEIILRNKKLIKLKVDKERFFGWKTIRKFYVGLGVRLPFLFMSIIISFLIFKLETKDKYLKRALFFLQTSCYGLSFYYMLWVFWYSQDYSIVAYRWFFIAFSLSSAAATVYFISYRNVFVSNLETKLKGVVSYILEIRTKHFPKMAINSLEVDEEATIKGINQFELRTVEELEKIAK